jgi:signal transduction histidine kinase
MSLRLLTRLFAAVLSALIILAAGALVGITTQLHRLTARVGYNMESVRAAEEVERQLLWHARASYLHAVSGDAHYASREASALSEIQRWQKVAGKYVGEPGEQPLLVDLTAKTAQYLEEYERRLHAGKSHLEVHVESAPFLLSACAAAERLVETNVNRAYTARALAAHWDSVANGIGLAVTLALVFGVGGVVLTFETKLYRPLLALRDTIARFANDQTRIRAAENGPAELREIAHAFNEMSSTIERHRQNQLRFLAGVAHDLRNPLGAIKMGISTIPPHDPSAPKEHVEFTLNVIVRQVDLLNRMIVDLLDATRVQAGQLQLRLEDCDLRKPVQNVSDLFRLSSTRHEIILRLADDPVMSRCDPARIEQVVGNLVSNAIKYSPAGGRVEIVLEREDGKAIIAVADQGIGIPIAEKDLIFEPFRRSDLSRETIPGVGLGLSVARRIVEAHGGTITVQSSPGEGSTFRVSLPGTRG